MSVAVTEKQGNTLNVCPEGRLDTVRTPQLDKELQPDLEGVSQIVMDFSRVTYISSSGLRLLVWLEQEMEARGGEVRVIHAGESVMKTFSMVGFENAVHIIPD